MLQRTPLYNAAVKAGGKMVDFHGWELAVQFSGIIAEHDAVRNAAGIFDVSHMGQIFIEGKDAHKMLQTLTSNDIKHEEGAGTYSHILNEKGGVVDDIIAFCLEKDKFLVVVNSATTDKDFAWFNTHSKGFKVKITNSSDEFGMVAVQGPKAMDISETLVENISDLPRFHIEQKVIFGSICYITRTGYTGEDGVEIMAHPSAIEKIWDHFLTEGKDEGLIPCGLGARDVLRLEAGYLLYGSDIDDSHTSYEASCGWVVKLKKAENFTAKAILVKQKEEGIKQKLTYFKLKGPGVPRPHNGIFYEGKQIGELSSGTYSPLFKGIGCGYCNVILKEGTEVEIDNNGRRMPAEVVTKFYKNRV